MMKLSPNALSKPVLSLISTFLSLVPMIEVGDHGTSATSMLSDDWLSADTAINTQHLPSTATWTTIMCGLLLLYGIDTPGGLFPHSAQGACISLAAAGSIASILMTLGVKRVSFYLRKQVRLPNTIRMSLLGLVLVTFRLLHYHHHQSHAPCDSRQKKSSCCLTESKLVLPALSATSDQHSTALQCSLSTVFHKECQNATIVKSPTSHIRSQHS